MAAAVIETWPSAGTRLLLGEQGVIDMVGNSAAAGLGERFGILLAQERAPDADGRSAAERSLALDAGEHLAEHGMEELRLEIDRGGVRPGLGVVGGLGSGACARVERDRAGERGGGGCRKGRGGEGGPGGPNSTSISGAMAP